MIRLFIALKIEDDIKQKFNAIINDFKTKGGNIKWVDTRNMHITLKFLGNTDSNLVENISHLMEKSVSGFNLIQSDFTMLGGFPNLRKPKVIWVDLEKNRNQIIELANKIHDALEDLQINHSEKEFKPHLTLGRVKSYEELQNLTDYLATYKFETIASSFNKVQLIQSTLTQRGPLYKTIKEVTLSERFGN